MININEASDAEIPVIEDILLDVCNWLESIGQPMWTKAQIKWEWLSKSLIAGGENNHKPSVFKIAYLDGVPAGCMAVVDHDPVIWPDIPIGESLFVHKLAVKRFAAGQGVADALLTYAKKMSADAGLPVLRLDTDLNRPKLRAVYERNGFTLAGNGFCLGDSMWRFMNTIFRQNNNYS